MRKINKTKIPTCLTEEYKNTTKTVQQDRTERWEKRVKNNKQSSFSWYGLNNDCFIPKLLEITNEHCSFCDKSIDADVAQIEHFKPKVKYPKSAFDWNNLYAICSACNLRKKDRYNSNLLKPDIKNYKFENHFEFKTKTGFIISKNNKALITIDFYKLNRAVLLKKRKEELKKIEGRISDKIKINKLEYLNNFCQNKTSNNITTDNEIIIKFISEEINQFAYRNFIEYCYSI